MNQAKTHHFARWAKKPAAHKWLTGPVLALFAVLVIGAAMLSATGSAHAAWPGNNGKIVFKTSANNGNDDQIWTVNPDGTGLTQLTIGNDGSTRCGAGDEEPVWSPDGTRIVFTSSRSGVQEVWVMNWDGSGQTRLTHTGADDESCEDDQFSENPSWSPDGTKIIFTRAVSGQREDLWIMNADGSNPHLFYASTDIDTDDSEAMYSPDGKLIAFQKDGNVCAQLWIMNANGTNVHAVIGDQECHTYENYSWSPDSKSIAMTGNVDAGDEVYTIWPDGTHFVQRTNDVAGSPSEHPAYSPDGKKIVIANGSSSDELFIMNPDGSSPTKLDLGNFISQGQPDWQPIPVLRHVDSSGNLVSDQIVPNNVRGARHVVCAGHIPLSNINDVHVTAGGGYKNVGDPDPTFTDPHFFISTTGDSAGQTCFSWISTEAGDQEITVQFKGGDGQIHQVSWSNGPNNGALVKEWNVLENSRISLGRTIATATVQQLSDGSYPQDVTRNLPLTLNPATGLLTGSFGVVDHFFGSHVTRTGSPWSGPLTGVIFNATVALAAPLRA